MVFEKTLIFGSEPASKKNSNNKPEDFEINFVPTIQLDENKKYKCALVSLSASYSWHNIQTQSNNNLIKYSPDGGITFKDILFPDGVYSYSDINSYIHTIMKENGDFTIVSDEDTFDINISFSLSTFLVTIDLSNGYQLDLNTQQFANLLGYDVGIITAPVSEGVRLPNITNSIDNILVHCSLVNGSVLNGIPTNTLFEFSTATLSRSYSFQFEPFNLSYVPMVGGQIQTVRIYITDINGRIIDLNGIPTTYKIKIMEA